MRRRVRAHRRMAAGCEQPTECDANAEAQQAACWRVDKGAGIMRGPRDWIRGVRGHGDSFAPSRHRDKFHHGHAPPFLPQSGPYRVSP